MLPERNGPQCEIKDIKPPDSGDEVGLTRRRLEAKADHRELGPARIIELETKYTEFFSRHGYQLHEPVRLDSGIDPTVRFIGSHISVFKPYILGREIPSPGLFIVQECLRTRNSRYFYDSEKVLSWASYFTSLGLIAPPERLTDVVRHTISFINSELAVPLEDIRIHINSDDNDLVNACRLCCDNNQLQFNTMPSAYYTHKLGMEGISGRNFNIALRNKNSGEFSDIGNIILIESTAESLGVELALGTTTILKQLHGQVHVLENYPITIIETDQENTRRKFEDALIVSVILSRLGLQPRGSGNRERIYRSYLRSLSYFRAKTGITLDILHQIISGFESRQFSTENQNVADKIIEYLTRFEKEILSKSELSDEEQQIATALGNK